MMSWSEHAKVGTGTGTVKPICGSGPVIADRVRDSQITSPRKDPRHADT